MDGDTPVACGFARLLVSVRNVEEAIAAVDGGADIIDVKEPARGSLGMAEVETIAEIVKRVETLGTDFEPQIDGVAGVGASRNPGVRRTGASRWSSPGHPPLSAALGELRKWKTHGAIPQLPACLDYVKLGLAGCRNSSNWRREWLEVRHRFERVAERPLNWVAVVYADWREVGAPPPGEVIRAAAETHCAGVLFDTHIKSRGSLLDMLPPSELSAWADRVRNAGLLLAIAGGICCDGLSRLARLSPDIVAIRTAACVGGRRTGRVSAARVAKFRAALRLPANVTFT